MARVKAVARQTVVTGLYRPSPADNMMSKLPGEVVSYILGMHQVPMSWMHVLLLGGARMFEGGKSRRVLEIKDLHNVAAACKQLRDICYKQDGISVDLELPSATSMRICPTLMPHIHCLRLSVQNSVPTTLQQLRELLAHAAENQASQLASVHKLVVECVSEDMGESWETLLQLVPKLKELDIESAVGLNFAALSQLTKLSVISEPMPMNMLPGLVSSVTKQLQHLRIELSEPWDTTVSFSLLPLSQLTQLTHLSLTLVDLATRAKLLDRGRWPCLPSLKELNLCTMHIDVNPLPALYPHLRTLGLTRCRVTQPVAVECGFTVELRSDFNSFTEETLNYIWQQCIRKLPTSVSVTFAPTTPVWYLVEDVATAGPQVFRRAADMTRLGLLLGDVEAMFTALLGLVNAQIPLKHLLIDDNNFYLNCITWDAGLLARDTRLVMTEDHEAPSFVMPSVEELSIGIAVDAHVLRVLLRLFPSLHTLRLPLDADCWDTATASDAMLLSAVRGTTWFVHPRANQAGVYDLLRP